MRRREFIAILAGGVGMWTLDASAEQSAIPVIGFLSSASPKAYAGRVAGFRKGLNESGYVDGQNVTIEFRWAQGQYDRLPVFAADLVQQKVAVIVSSGGDVAALSAKATTSSIPIVTVSGSDPVKAGLVASFNRPGGNVTGASFVATELETKRLEILHDDKLGMADAGPGAAGSRPLERRERFFGAGRGGVIIRTPTNPTISADQRWMPTFSFRMAIERTSLPEEMSRSRNPAEPIFCRLPAGGSRIRTLRPSCGRGSL